MRAADVGRSVALVSMSEENPNERDRYPLNAKGEFYVENGICLCCMIPEIEAAELMAFDNEAMHCYFKQQPLTSEDLEHAIAAVAASASEASSGFVPFSVSSPSVMPSWSVSGWKITSPASVVLPGTISIGRVFPSLVSVADSVNRPTASLLRGKSSPSSPGWPSERLLAYEYR